MSPQIIKVLAQCDELIKVLLTRRIKLSVAIDLMNEEIEFGDSLSGKLAAPYLAISARVILNDLESLKGNENQYEEYISTTNFKYE